MRPPKFKRAKKYKEDNKKILKQYKIRQKQKMHQNLIQTQSLSQSLPQTNNNMLNSSCLQTYGTFATSALTYAPSTVLKERNVLYRTSAPKGQTQESRQGAKGSKSKDQQKQGRENQYGEKIVFVNNISFITNKKCDNYQEKVEKKVIPLNRSRSRSNNHSRTKDKKPQIDATLTETQYIIPQVPQVRVPDQIPLQLQIPIVHSRQATQRTPIPHLNLQPSPAPSCSHPSPTPQPYPHSLVSSSQVQIPKLLLKIEILQKRISNLHTQNQQIQLQKQRSLSQKTNKINQLEQFITVLIHKTESKDQEISGLWKMVEELRESKGSHPKIVSDDSENSQNNTTQNFINLTLSQEIQKLRYENEKLAEQLRNIKQQNTKLIQLQRIKKQSLQQTQSLQFPQTTPLQPSPPSPQPSPTATPPTKFHPSPIFQQNLQQSQQILQIASQQLQIEQIINRISEITKQNQLLRAQLFKNKDIAEINAVTKSVKGNQDTEGKEGKQGQDIQEIRKICQKWRRGGDGKQMLGGDFGRICDILGV